MSDITVDASQSDDAGLPSKLFSTREIATKALEMVGAFTPMDGAPDDADLDRAIEWMELGVAEAHGIERFQWLVPATLEFELEADTLSYLLSDVAGSSFPSLRVAYPIAAYVRVDGSDSTGTECPVDIIRRKAYEEIGTKDTSGTPGEVYIDRTNDDPTIYVHPVPTSTDTTTYLRILCETYAKSVLGPSADPGQAGDQQHGFDRAWQLWLIRMTAALIGTGPVRKLSKSDLDSLKADRDHSFGLLMGRQNRENQSMRLRRTRRYGG